MPRSPRTLICSCEDVSLADVNDALKRGYRDVESVKRYTGFGTGICQGRHCLGTVARLLLQEGAEDATIQPTTPRPPLEPVRMGVLAGAADEEDAS